MVSFSALLPEHTINDRYRLVRQLGEGGVGTVWRARDTRLGLDVAVKVLRDGQLAPRAVAEAFRREADLCARMMSPHVVKVLDSGVDDSNRPFMVMELLEGETLAERLEREERLPLADCVTVVVHACRALSRAHSLGVVHRDIKPENLFLGEDRGRLHVKLFDFGIALRELPGAGAPQQLAGTYEYMAPEILLDGKAADARSDLFSLGAVAHRCFTGVVPYPGAAVGAVMLAHTAGPPPAPSSKRPVQFELRAPINAWFVRALARDPADRFGSATEMGGAMADLTSRPAHALGRD